MKIKKLIKIQINFINEPSPSLEKKIYPLDQEIALFLQHFFVLKRKFKFKILGTVKCTLLNVPTMIIIFRNEQITTAIS